MIHQPRIALALPNSIAWGITRFLNGVNSFASKHNWRLTSCPVDPEDVQDCPFNWSRLKSWRVDGVIIQSGDLKQKRILRKLNIPVVNISEEKGVNSIFPKVTQNNRRIARLAADHLIGLGLKNLAYHGIQDRWYSAERLHGFKQAANEAHFSCKSFCLPHTARDALWNERYDLIKRWLKTLPLPVGLFAVNDYRALIVLSACHEIGLRVPDDVAVVGADNDLMVCEFSTPTLTSVCVNAHRMGFEAASLLNRLMHGEPPPRNPILIDPIEVLARESTNVLHVDDPVVKRAIQFMQQHFSEAFKMDVVAKAVGVSRRSLEMRFRAERKTSPAEHLANLRVTKAKAMLADNNCKKNSEIARSCGFGTGKNMSASLRRLLNASPNDFRPD